MKIRTMLAILLSINFSFSYAQNERENREEFKLELAINKKQYYEQKIESSPYFVRENVLQIYPGEKLFIEVEIDKKEVTAMKVVSENLNPEKTIEVEFTQKVKDKKNEMMLLKVVNPFKKSLDYKAMMFIVGHDDWISTKIPPVKAKLFGVATWPDVVITLVLLDWKLK